MVFVINFVSSKWFSLTYIRYFLVLSFTFITVSWHQDRILEINLHLWYFTCTFYACYTIFTQIPTIDRILFLFLFNILNLKQQRIIHHILIFQKLAVIKENLLITSTIILVKKYQILIHFLFKSQQIEVFHDQFATFLLNTIIWWNTCFSFVKTSF